MCLIKSFSYEESISHNLTKKVYIRNIPCYNKRGACYDQFKKSLG